MTYVLAGTQLATLVALCFVISWVIDDKNNTNQALYEANFKSEERLERVMRDHGLEMQQLFEALSEKAFIEREQLLNRLTHPDIAAAAVPSAVEGHVGVEDDEEDQPLPAPEEDKPAEDRIPMKDLLVRPHEPQQPMGAMTFEDDEEEYDGVS